MIVAVCCPQTIYVLCDVGEVNIIEYIFYVLFSRKKKVNDTFFFFTNVSTLKFCDLRKWVGVNRCGGKCYNVTNVWALYME